jgi:hypothetical protein
MPDITVSYPPSDLQALIPQPATAMPPGVSDSGAVGTSQKYALENHTHASKARKQRVTMGSAASTYTWVYPTAFASGIVPIVSAIVQVSAGNQDLFNVQVIGQPTNTQCVFQINRVSSGLLSLLTGALSINPTPVAATLHCIALEP